MTTIGIIHVFSALYLSFAICLAVSVNEQRGPARIVRETLRRWLKFVALSLLIALVVFILG